MAWAVTACQSPKPRPSHEAGPPRAKRDNCYSLLHDLLNDEKRVGLLRFIKREEEDVKNLVKRIASVSGTGAKLLKEFAKRDPSIDLTYTRLPPGEAATREAIAATKQKELLSQNGAEFELSLLLSQAEALSYGCHLAKVAGESEAQPDRARALAGLSEDLRRLHQEVYRLLLSRMKTAK
jgi:hypothetical protein